MLPLELHYPPVLRKKIVIFRVNIKYLKLGAGNACAGHSKVMLSPPLASKARLLSPVVNLGETRPTGSIDQNNATYNKKTVGKTMSELEMFLYKIIIPECWGRERLRRAK